MIKTILIRARHSLVVKKIKIINWFILFVYRLPWVYDLKIKWNSLGIWSRLRGKNKVMAYLLRPIKRKPIVFFRLGRFFVMWQRINRPVISSNGIPLPNPPLKSRHRLLIRSVVHNRSRIKPTKVVFDSRPTEVVLDELCKNRKQ